MRLNQTKAMILLTVLFSSGTAFAQSYVFERLTPLSGGRTSYAQAINNSGVVVGTTQFSAACFGCGGTTRATAWNNTVAMPLSSPDRHSYAMDVNDMGQAVGWGVPGYTTWYSAYKWNSVDQFPTSLESQYRDETVSAINNIGQVAGFAATPDGPGSAVVWDSNGNATYLGYRSGFSPLDINDAGLVVGNVDGRAAIWNSTLATVIYLEALGDISGTARAINDMGQVVGNSQVIGGIHATLWNGSSIVDLGTLGGHSSYAEAINNLGQVVGDSHTKGGDRRPMLWDGTTMTDLNSFLDANTKDQGWSLYSASDINDVGQIVGTAVNGITGEYHAFLLTPVPEPSEYALMLSGLGFVGFMARRRRQQQELNS